MHGVGWGGGGGVGGSSKWLELSGWYIYIIHTVWWETEQNADS